jgi:amino acid permease
VTVRSDARSPFPDLEELLGGLPAKRAATLLFLIETRTAHLVARSRQVTERLLTEESARERELSFLTAFALGGEPPLRPTIQDLERHSAEWAGLVADNPRVRAAVGHQLAEKYDFTYAAVPGIREALGLDEPAVEQAYERLYGRPLQDSFEPRAKPLERLRWAWSRLAAWLESLPPFWTAYSLTLTETVGASVLALPIAVAALGPLPGLAVLIALGLVNVITVTFMAEAVSRSGEMRYGHAFFGRLVTDFLGRSGAALLTGSLLLFCFLVLQIYYFGVATTLADATAIPAGVWVALMFLVGVYYLRRESLNATIASALVVGAVNIALLVALSLLALSHVRPDNLLYENVPFVGGTPFEPALVGLIFGVVLTAYNGHTSVAICGQLVVRRDPSARSLILGCAAAQGTAIVLYSLFVLGVNGAVAPDALATESGTALAPLAVTAGPAVHVIGSAFVVLGMGMSSITYSLALFGLVRERLPSAAARIVTLPRRRGRIVFSTGARSPAERLEVGLTYLGLHGGQPRFLVEVEHAAGSQRAEVVAAERWDVLPAEASAMVEELRDPTGGRARLDVEIAHADDQSVRMRVTTPMRRVYEGQPDRTGFALAALLELTDAESETVAWMIRRGEVTAAEAAAHRGGAESAAERALDALAERGVIGRRVDAGRPRYTARAGLRRPRRLPPQLWQALDVGASEASGRPGAARGVREVIFGRRGRFALATAPVAAAFIMAEFTALTGSGSFAGPLSFLGTITVSILAGVFPVLLLLSSRRKGEYVPAVVLHRMGHPYVLGAIYLLFVAGVTLHGLVVWDGAAERAGALLIAAVIVVVTVSATRRGAFGSRLAIELREDQASGAASFAVTAAGRPVTSDIRFEYGEGDRRLRAAEGEIHEFRSLRRASFEPLWASDDPVACAELKVWVHGVTPEGDSEGRAGRVRVEGDDQSGVVDLPLSRGRAVLPAAVLPRKVEIVLG